MILKGHIRQKVDDFFTKGHQRSINAKKNIAGSFLIKGASIIINLALVPITINYVNPTRYGIWLTLSSIVFWFSFFDMGFGHGMRNRFAEAKARGQIEKARIYISTTYAILAIIFGSIWILLICINFYIKWVIVLNAPPGMAYELSVLAIIVFSFFCIQMVLKTINTVLIADQKPAIASFFDLLGQLLALIIVLVLVKTTKGSLVYLGLGLGFSPILIYLFSSLILYSGNYKEYSPTKKYIRFSYAKDIISLGAKFFLIQISAVIIFQTTNIVIAQTLNPNHVTVYNIAYKYFSVLSLAFMIVVTPFWSAFTDAYSKGEMNWMIGVVSQLKRAWLLLLPVALIMIVCSTSLYKIWIGSSVRIPFLVSLLMAVYLLLFTRFNMFILLINGIGKVQLQLYINIGISIVYIPLAIFTCSYYSIPGLLILNILVALIHSIISEIQIQKLTMNRGKGIWIK